MMTLLAIILTMFGSCPTEPQKTTWSQRECTLFWSHPDHADALAIKDLTAEDVCTDELP